MENINTYVAKARYWDGELFVLAGENFEDFITRIKRYYNEEFGVDGIFEVKVICDYPPEFNSPSIAKVYDYYPDEDSFIEVFELDVFKFPPDHFVYGKIK